MNDVGAFGPLSATSAVVRRGIDGLFDRARGPIVYVAITTTAAFVTTIALVYATYLAGLLGDAEDPAESVTRFAVSAVIAAPVIENLLLFGLIEFLLALKLRPLAITLTIAILSGLGHWMAGEWRAIAGAVLFAVMTHSYFVWDDRTIGWRYRLTVVQHALFNAPAALLWAWNIAK